MATLVRMVSMPRTIATLIICCACIPSYNCSEIARLGAFAVTSSLRKSSKFKPVFGLFFALIFFLNWLSLAIVQEHLQQQSRAQFQSFSPLVLRDPSCEPD